MRIAVVTRPDAFEDWYQPLGIDRREFLAAYQGEGMLGLALALALGRAGADVHLFHTTLGRAEVAEHKPSGATAHFVPAPLAYRGLRRAVWGHGHWQKTSWAWPAAPVAPTLSARLVRQVLGVRPDVVVVQDYESLRYDVLAPLLRATGLRMAGLDTGASARPSSRPWKRRTAGLADVLLATHQAEADRLRCLGHLRARVWPAVVRSDLFAPGERAAARAALGVSPGARLVVSAGRLHPVKGLHDLADACAALGCELALVGSGPERDGLARRADVSIRLPGRLPPEEVARWYAAADVVALASRHEGQPVAVLEALCCARAVVATAVGGVSEVVLPGLTGWLVPPRDTRALAAALAEALSDAEWADALGRAGRRLVVDRHSPDAAGRAILGMLSA